MTSYNVSDLIPVLKLKPRAIRKLLASRKLKGQLVGRQWIVSEDSLRRFLGEMPQQYCSGESRFQQRWNTS